jgi:ubiquinone/menaquinone biosynthesis C-methylase UbiE
MEAMMTLRSSPAPGGEQQLFAPLSFPEIYEQALVGPLFRPWADPILEDVELRDGDRVLDIACGTGIVARLAKERLREAGAVVGVDVSAQMLAVAHRVAPGIDWRQGDAGALPLRDDEKFDVIVCQQGLQFFSDRVAAACQMHRALAAHGRVAVSTWRSDEEFPVLRQLRGVVERHLGPIVDRRHSFGEAGALETLLRETGFRNVRSKTVARTIRFDDGSVFVRLNAMALVSMSRASSAMSDEERQRIVVAVTQESADLVRLHSDGTGFAFELGTNVAMATA